MAAQSSRPLDGRTVLVTGGTRGIGRAVVEAGHRDGASVVVHYRSATTAGRSPTGLAAACTWSPGT